MVDGAPQPGSTLLASGQRARAWLAKHRFLVSVFVVCPVKIVLDSGLLLFVDASQRYDDLLFVKQAESLLAGNYLGPYDQLTLARHPGYPLWLALNAALHLPLLVSQSALYLGAGVAVSVRLRRLGLGDAWAIALLVVYAFNPFVEVRVLRAGIYGALAVWSLAGMLAVVSQRRAPLTTLGRVAATSGIALGAFWLTREEGIWLLPSIALLLVYAAVDVVRLRTRDPLWRQRLALLMLPACVAASASLLVAATNYHFYRAFILNEQTGGTFTQAVGALRRVQVASDKPMLPVPRAARLAAYDMSPSFRELAPFIDGSAGDLATRRSWVQLSCQLYPPTCGDFAGAWFVSALRDATAAAGHYRNHQTAQAFFAKLAYEINDACGANTLSCGPPQDSLAPLNLAVFRHAVSRAAELTPLVLSVPVRSFVLDPSIPSRGQPQAIERFARLTRTAVHLPAGRGTKALGIRLRILAAIAAIYRSVFAYLCLAGFSGLLLAIAISIRRRRISIVLLFAVGVATAFLARLFLLAVVDVTSFPAFTMWACYSSPLYPLLCLGSVLGLRCGASALRGRV